MEPEQFIPQRVSEEGSQKEKWHTCLSTAPGPVQEEGSARLVPAASGAPAAAGCFLSHERGGRNKNGTGLLRGRGQGLGKGFGNWNLWGFLLTERWEGERLFLETSYFNQMHSRWGTSCTVSFLAFHIWVQRLPSRLQHRALRSKREPWLRHPMENKGSLSWAGSPKALQQNPWQPEIKQHGQ